MKRNMKTGRTDPSRAIRKDSVHPDISLTRLRVAAAIGRAALCGLLPLRFAERLIRRVRGAA
jgi:hypothetical protein